MPLSKKGYRAYTASSIADLRHQVQIQYPDESTRDASGQIVNPWVNPVIVAEMVWARVEPLSAREQLLSGQVQADITHKVELRYDPLGVIAVTPKHRLIWLTGPNNNVLQVVSAPPRVGLTENIMLLCTEEV